MRGMDDSHTAFNVRDVTPQYIGPRQDGKSVVAGGKKWSHGDRDARRDNVKTPIQKNEETACLHLNW
jgi:hypothetical protein